MDYLLTDDGAAMMTKAVAGKNLVFTRAETGTGYSSFPATLPAVIGMCQKMTMDVSQDGSDLKIICFLNNRQLEERYTLKQVGVYAKLEGDEEDTLVIIGQQYSGEVIHSYAEGETEYEFTILMRASGTSSITVESGAESLSSKFKQLRKEWEAVCDETNIKDSFYKVFTLLEAAVQEAMTTADIEAALTVKWNGESSPDKTAMSSYDVQEAVEGGWNGESSEDKTALTAEEIGAVIR